MMYLIVPLSERVSAGVTQFAGEMFVVICRFHPVEGEGQETCAVFVLVSVMLSTGAPGVCTA